MPPAGPTDGHHTEGTRKGEGTVRGIELSDPARVNLLPLHEPAVRSRRGNEADSLGRQLFPPHYFGGYEVQGCRARRWFSEGSLLDPLPTPASRGEEQKKAQPRIICPKSANICNRST